MLLILKSIINATKSDQSPLGISRSYNEEVTNYGQNEKVMVDNPVKSHLSGYNTYNIAPYIEIMSNTYINKTL